MLRDIGCDRAERYLVSHPLPPDRFLAWLSTSSSAAPALPAPRQLVLG